MTKNVVAIYEDEEGLLKRFNDSLTPNLPNWVRQAEKERGVQPFSYYDSSKLGNPTVVADEIAKRWLELNYLFATDFAPKRKPGVGLTGADIRTVDPQNKNIKYLTTDIGLFAFTLKALKDFRLIEPIQEEYFANFDKYHAQVNMVVSGLEKLMQKHPELERFRKPFENTQGYVGFTPTYMPSQEFVGGLNDLGKALEDISSKDELAIEVGKTATELSVELDKYSALIPKMAEIRKYHKTIPFISSDGFIRLNSPVASGGLCMVTFPAYDDPYNCLPSDSALFLLASQTGSLSHLGVAPVVGAGETQGEQYIMHVPRKHFFEEVQKEVDDKNSTNIKEVIEIKRAVLEKRFDDIMRDEILGFRTSAKRDDRTVVLSPVISEREYERNKSYLKSHFYSPENLDLQGVLIEVASRYVPYNDQIKALMISNMDKLVNPGETK